MQMYIQVLKKQGTKYYLKAFGVPPVELHFDYKQDFRDRLRKAQAWNRGTSLFYSSR
jgi:hypothetical protein